MKNIFSILLTTSLLGAPTLVGMELSSPIKELPQELKCIIKDHADVPLKISSKDHDKYLSKEDCENGKSTQRLLATSFGKCPFHMSKMIVWSKFLNETLRTVHCAIGTPTRVLIGFEQRPCEWFKGKSVPMSMWPSSSKGAGIDYTTAEGSINGHIVDGNALGHGCVAHSYSDSVNKHFLQFFEYVSDQDYGKGKRNWLCVSHNEPGIVTALTMYPNAPRVVYLTDHGTSCMDMFWSSNNNTSQRMVVAEREVDDTVSIKVSAPTPYCFTEITPFDTNDLLSHFALSASGCIWKIFGHNDGAHFSKQTVRGRDGQEKTYKHIAINEEGLMAAMDNEGNVFVGDPLFKKPVLMLLDTISHPGNVLRFTHTKNAMAKEGHCLKDLTSNKIHVVYDKPFFGKNYPIVTIVYNYNALILAHLIKDRSMFDK